MPKRTEGKRLTKAMRDDALAQAEVEEACLACRFCVGSIVTMCMNPKSEFGMSFVYPAGYCAEFSLPDDAGCIALKTGASE